MNPKELGFELLHVGINTTGADEGASVAQLMADLFGFELRETSGSWFANNQFEIMKMPYLGTHGHLSLGTTDATAARAWLESKGYTFNESTAQYDDAGKLKLVYANEEIAGFAFHITQK